MRCLNLYSGLGGNRKLWSDVDVTAVEWEDEILQVYKNQFPNDNIIQGDAHKFLLEHYNEFDFIWSSPPCQTHSRMMKATRHKSKQYPDLSLYQEIIFLKEFFKGKWVVENVKPYYEPLISTTKIIGRHYFWSNFDISDFELNSPKGFITTGTVKESERLKEWLGIYYDGNIYYKNNHCPGQVLRNCVHPKLGQHVYSCSLS